MEKDTAQLNVIALSLNRGAVSELRDLKGREKCTLEKVIELECSGNVQYSVASNRKRKCCELYDSNFVATVVEYIQH
jgi:hypothetical protein